MTQYPIFGSAQPDDSLPTVREPDPSPENPILASAVPPNGDRVLPAHDIEAALQLLVERARYITGATGAALALLQGEEMVCRASAGSSAPAVGARLQVLSGLTGESVSRKQLLRCDNAENDPRVNLTACRELGIASIVVLPLLARTGEVRGLFELFSDHAYAFEERDLIALERMADLTRTALDLSEKREVSVVIAPSASEIQPMEPATTAPPNSSPVETRLAASPPSPEPVPSPQMSAAPIAPTQEISVPAPPPLVIEEPPVELEPVPIPVPEAMLRVQKCASCGFPISEGRSLCMDCESKQPHPSASTEIIPAEDVPAFLTSQKPADESWLANHVNLLAVAVLILSIVVAVVVFR